MRKRQGDMLDGLAAWLAATGRVAPHFATLPPPRADGDPLRGAQLMAAARSPLDAPRTPFAETAALTFRWLDDLAALGSRAARERAWLWLEGWDRRTGWHADLSAGRLRRWIGHAEFLTGPGRSSPRALLAGATREMHFLRRRWKSLPEGPARVEALTALVTGSLALARMRSFTGPFARGLATEAARSVDPGGAVASRNPEELLDLLTLLVEARDALSAAGLPVPPAVTDAIQRAAPTLRLLRQADGGLPRLHGGGTPPPGKLDRALLVSGARANSIAGAPAVATMGYLRLAASRTTLIVDAAPPPMGTASRLAHASTLAFELTSGRRPLIVSCGPGSALGADWENAARATPSHSVLGIEGLSSARLGTRRDTEELLSDGPRNVRAEVTTGDEGPLLVLSHDGYVASHGLTHVRELELSRDGRMLRGYDALGAATEPDRRVLERAILNSRLQGVHFTIRFHLHPAVKAKVEAEQIVLHLPSKEVWIFRQAGAARMSLDASVWLDPHLSAPRPSRQIVLSGLVADKAGEVGWTLAKSEDTPLAIRDTEPAEEELPQAARAIRADA
ncbi:heparinase II/III family protein [Haematobacter missouriensis]|nr:heparinase II/III family protein [Haematobacter missouriensis]